MVTRTLGYEIDINTLIVTTIICPFQCAKRSQRHWSNLMSPFKYFAYLRRDKIEEEMAVHGCVTVGFINTNVQSGISSDLCRQIPFICWSLLWNRGRNVWCAFFTTQTRAFMRDAFMNSLLAMGGGLGRKERCHLLVGVNAVKFIRVSPFVLSNSNLS